MLGLLSSLLPFVALLPSLPPSLFFCESVRSVPPSLPPSLNPPLPPYLAAQLVQGRGNRDAWVAAHQLKGHEPREGR